MVVAASWDEGMFVGRGNVDVKGCPSKGLRLLFEMSRIARLFVLQGCALKGAVGAGVSSVVRAPASYIQN